MRRASAALAALLVWIGPAVAEEATQMRGATQPAPTAPAPSTEVPASEDVSASETPAVDPAVAETRIDGAFRVLAAPPTLALDQPAAGPTEAPGAPALPEIGYAPASEPDSPTDRLFAVGPRQVAVPVPRRRPSVPTVATQVAALDEAAATHVPARLAETRPILAGEDALGPPKKIPKEALPYLRLIEREAAKNKVPLWLAIGVGWVESKYDARLRGSHTVVGIMQVMPSTARWQGYKGTAEGLLDPETNIVWGMKELGWDYASAKGDACLAIAKYKAGIMATRVSTAAADYCRRAKIVTGML
ncbi:MAG: transglycosylase SLT domain-containing protein [Phyllobacteriaceae bacterium]|nr:transglycosylase SLT domain-containing protein [Phyllobacteriaceae bacterium]